MISRSILCCILYHFHQDDCFQQTIAQYMLPHIVCLMNCGQASVALILDEILRMARGQMKYIIKCRGRESTYLEVA